MGLAKRCVEDRDWTLTEKLQSCSAELPCQNGREIPMGFVRREAVENAPHPFLVFGMPDAGRPVGLEIDEPASAPQYSVYFAAGFPEIACIFEHLDTVSGIELAVLMR